MRQSGQGTERAMETTYLQEYVRVADRGSFTAAARELHLTQSTLSKHVAALEREFGAELFVRDRTGISMTEAGKLLYAQALRFAGLLAETKALVRGAHEGTGSVSAPRALGAAAGAAADAQEAFVGRDTALRCACRLMAGEYGLDEREVGALVLYLEESGFETIQAELGLSRDEVAEVLGRVYRKIGVSGKQEALDLVYSVSE